MGNKDALKPIGTYYRFTPSVQERKIEASLLRRILFEIFVIREFEIRLLELKDRGLAHGPVHSSIGQEGAAVGAMMALDRGDVIGSTHRGHHHFLAKAFGFYLDAYDPGRGIPEGMLPIVTKTMAEILGLAQGYCRGRGGSMHLGDRTSGCLGTNAIVAGGVPILTGAAWAQGMDSSGKVGVSFMGDGAAQQGAVHEVMNMAALWKIPVIYFIENNLYAVATHVRESCNLEHLAQRGLGYGLESLVVDGMDPVAVFLATREARRTSLAGTPVLIEAKTYRYRHQAQGLPGSAFGYRTRAEEEEWLRLDPVIRFPEELETAGVLSREGAESLKKTAWEMVDRAAASLVKTEGGTLFIPQDLYPHRRELETGVRSDGREFASARWAELEDFPVRTTRTYVDVISEVIGRRLDTDPAGIVLGEEVGHMKGGAFLATRGIFLRHRERVIDTPISENGFSGMALGLALFGKRPIVEIMYPDFALVAADQLFNQIGKCRYMYGDQFDVPLIVRTRVAIGTGYGAQHSMEPAAMYALFSGWRIVAPSNPFDYIGLFNTAYRSLDPVLVIEHHELYGMTGEVPEDRDYLIPFGKARVVREGRDITILSWSLMTRRSLEAADLLVAAGISAEVVDLRTLDYPCIDWGTVGESLKKTGRLLIVEEGQFGGGLGAQICDQVQRRFFDFLDCEIGRVAGLDIPMPVSKALEDLSVPSAPDIEAAVRKIVR